MYAGEGEQERDRGQNMDWICVRSIEKKGCKTGETAASRQLYINYKKTWESIEQGETKSRRTRDKENWA